MHDEELTTELDDDNPLWCINAQINGFLDGIGATEDIRAITEFFKAAGLPNGTVDRILRALACAENPQGKEMTSEDLYQAANWLVHGETGRSSRYLLATAIAGRRIGDGSSFSYPKDCYDIQKCMALVDVAPSVAEVAFPILSRFCGLWAALIENWDELRALCLMDHGGREESWYAVTNHMRKLMGDV